MARKAAVKADLTTRSGDAGETYQESGQPLTPHHRGIFIDNQNSLKPSPALSLVAEAPETIVRRRIGVLMTDGADPALLAAIAEAAKAEGVEVVLVAPTISGVIASDGSVVLADHALSEAPSTMFDAVVVAPGEAGGPALLRDAAAVDWLRDAFVHLKVIGHVPAAKPLFDRAGVDMHGDAGTISLVGKAAAIEALLGMTSAAYWGSGCRLKKRHTMSVRSGVPR